MEWLWLKYRHNLLSPRQIISSRKGALTTETVSLPSFCLKSLKSVTQFFLILPVSKEPGKGDGASARGGVEVQSVGLIKTWGWEGGSSSFRMGIHPQPSILSENGSVFHKKTA